jgi:hypothetical protein
MGIIEYPGTIPSIQKEKVEVTSKRVIDLQGIEAIGFVEMVERTDECVITRKFPNLEAEPLEPIDRGFTLQATNGNTYALIGDLGKWCQVRRWSDETLGFMPSTNLDIHKFEDLLITENIEMKTSGVLVVGVDIPAGLYTLLPDEGETADLRVEDSGTAHDQHYIICGPSHYTIYLPEGATVVKSDDTLLRSTKDEFLIPYDLSRTVSF